MAVLSYPFMQQIPCLDETDDKSFLFPLLEKLVVEFAPVSSTVDRVNPLGADVSADHVIEDVPAPQTAYLTIDLFGEVPVVKVSRQAVFRLDERDGLVKRAGDVREFDVLRRLDSVEHFSNQSLLRLRQALGNDS
jgi:hypothetical protein